MKSNLPSTLVVTSLLVVISSLACGQQGLLAESASQEFIELINGQYLRAKGQVFTLPFCTYLFKQQEFVNSELSIGGGEQPKLRWWIHELTSIFKPKYEEMFINLIRRGYRIRLVPVTPRHPVYSSDKSPMLTRPVKFKFKVTPPSQQQHLCNK